MMDKDQKVKENTDTLMEDLGEGIGYIRAYVEQEIESVKLTAAEKISIATSTIVSGLILTLLAAAMLLFASLALSYYLGSLMNSTALGFLAVAGIYLLILLMVYLFRKRLITDNIVEVVIQFLFDEEEDSELG
ncbi:MAG: hypothetical protein R2824_06660 [Saprospiraceae bacterium]